MYSYRLNTKTKNDIEINDDISFNFFNGNNKTINVKTKDVMIIINMIFLTHGMFSMESSIKNTCSIDILPYSK